MPARFIQKVRDLGWLRSLIFLSEANVPPMSANSILLRSNLKLGGTLDS